MGQPGLEPVSKLLSSRAALGLPRVSKVRSLCKKTGSIERAGSNAPHHLTPSALEGKHCHLMLSLNYKQSAAMLQLPALTNSPLNNVDAGYQNRNDQSQPTQPGCNRMIHKQAMKHVVVAAADRRMGSCLWRWGVWKCVQIFITATACATNHWINTTGNAFCHPCPENTETLAVGADDIRKCQCIRDFYTPSGKKKTNNASIASGVGLLPVRVESVWAWRNTSKLDT
eukprot:1143672-Pelagomonas_calceolata.AAC.1